jgi:hypothetical protein
MPPSTFSFDNEYDQYAAPSLLPSPNEMSHMINDPVSLDQIDRKFKKRPISSAVIHNYYFITDTITRLETELERHNQERQTLHDYLMDDSTFRHRIRPIVADYRHRRALQRRGHHHPYGRTNPETSSSSSSSEEFPARMNILPHDRTSSPPPSSTSSGEIERNELDHLVTKYLAENPPNSPNHDIFDSLRAQRPGTPYPQPGSSTNPINADEYDPSVICADNGDYEGCGGNHPLSRCEFEHRWNHERQRYIPVIPIPDTHPIEYIPYCPHQEEGKDAPCTRCNLTGHSQEECDTPLKIRGFCNTCVWERREDGTCPHYCFPTPSFVRRTQEEIARQKEARIAKRIRIIEESRRDE